MNTLRYRGVGRVAVVSLPLLLVALGACNKREPAVPSLEQEPAPYEATEPAVETPEVETTDEADAGLLEKTAEKLDVMEDIETAFEAAPRVKLKGEASLEEEEHGVEIEVELSEGPPGVHAIHVHEKADCSNIPGKSMGGHLNPDGHPHGLPSAPQHHLGDLGNLTIDKDGKAEFEFTVAKANLKENDPMSLLGRAIVIHKKKDTGKGDSGQAGQPIACAKVISD